MGKITVGIGVLASGFSRRFGTEDKLLFPIDGIPMLQRVLQAAAGHDDTDLLVSCRIRETEDLCRNMQVPFLRNNGAAEGRAAAVRLLTENLSSCSGILFLPGDMPYLTHGDIGLLLEQFRLRPEAVTAASDGKVMHPAVFPKRLFPFLLSAQGDEGGGRLLRSRKEEIFTVMLPASHLRDVDIKE